MELKEEDHIGLIYKTAQKLANKHQGCIHAFGRDVSEYIGEGFLGLRKAIQNYDPTLGVTFGTYATAVIKDRLISAARKHSLIKVSFQARYQAIRFMQGKDIKVGDEKKVKDALKVMQGTVSSLSEQTDKGLEQNLPYWELLEELEARLNRLDDRTREIIILRYGLSGEEPLTLDEVGKALEPPITRERVRQIEKAGLAQLKEVINV